MLIHKLSVENQLKIIHFKMLQTLSQTDSVDIIYTEKENQNND